MQCSGTRGAVRRRLHMLRGIALTLAIFGASAGTLLAGTTGTISGTITDPSAHALRGVTVSAASPTGRASATTDGRGFFVMTGLSPDTYAVSFELPGYEAHAVSGVNVFADQVATVSQALTKVLSTIGRVTVRGPSGAFQPNQTADTYTFTSDQLTTQLGKSNRASETDLLASLPGVTTSSPNGYPVLRGGRENEEGFQFEGIDYTDAFAGQFVNSLALNGVASLQLTPGAGDASSGNAGTGVINLIVKKGTRPAFGTLDLEVLGQPFGHQLGIDYGFATPNGRFSDYVSYQGQRTALQYGARGAPAASLSTGTFYGKSFQSGDDLVNNAIFKFGPGGNQQLQFFYQTQTFDFDHNYGGIATLNYKSGDPYFLTNIASNTGLTNAQIQQTIGFAPGQSAVQQALDHASHIVQPNETFKLQYSNNLAADTFLTAKFYRVNAVSVFDLPYDTNAFGLFNEQEVVQGGQRSGFAVDLTKQLNSKNLVTVGGKFEYLHPVNSYVDASAGLLAISGFGLGLQIADFLSPTDTTGVCGFASCGYLSSYFPNGVPRVPAFSQQAPLDRQDSALYVSDSYAPNERLKIAAGLRLDMANYRLPGIDSGLYAPGTTSLDPQTKNPKVWQPRLGISYQLTRNDALRFSYGRSVQFAPLANILQYVTPDAYSQFAFIPSYDNQTGSAATYCGVSRAALCKNYGDQLYWANQALNGVPVQPLRPSTFNNFDLSYSHRFKHNVGLKVTPFYRRGYDGLALTASPLTNPDGSLRTDANGAVILGPTLASNLGVSRTTGVELLVTKEAALGFSGAFSATYINELTNVPPLSSGEDLFPSIPPASLALGNLYRVGFLTPLQATLAVQYKTKNGWRINPVVQYQRGYPLGAGSVTAVFINGKAYNVPSTNVTSPNGSTGATAYVDPQNPGSLTDPNIAATRGFTEGSSPGGFLSNARFNTNLTVEYSRPGTRSTLGIFVTNLFNQLYGYPTLNGRYQPLAEGIAGIKTGTSTNPINYPGIGFAQYGANRFGSDPFLISPVNAPTAIQFYYQLAL